CARGGIDWYFEVW
nr:immunoglobulin heavy chain junction region [Mus musculus]